MRKALFWALSTVAIFPAGCGGANLEPEEPTGGTTSGGAQIAGPTRPGRPQIAGGSATLEEAEYQLARHAADIVAIMRDHMNDCDRAARVCHAYVEHNRKSIDDAKARIRVAMGEWTPDYSPEDEVDRDLQRLLLEMEPDTEQIVGEFEDRCPGIADELGEALEF